MKYKSAVLAAAIALCSAAIAQPSSYYVWKNPATNAKMCDPEPPGPQWVKESGPYSDSNCSVKEPQ